MVLSFSESHHSRDPYHHAGQSTDYLELSPHALQVSDDKLVVVGTESI